MSRSLNRSVLVASLLLGAQHASALNIVITNDDGFETPNIQALYDALVAAGHDVILSAPYSGQSGTSGMIAFLRPIGPTSQARPEAPCPPDRPASDPQRSDPSSSTSTARRRRPCCMALMSPRCMPGAPIPIL